LSFPALVDELLADFFRLYPVHATDLGNHEHDGRWPDLTDEGRAERLAFLDRSRRTLEDLDGGGLSRDDAIDRRILLDEIASLRFDEETLLEDRWNPLGYVYLFGGGLFSLLAREFAPLEVRLGSAASRLRGLPAALDVARLTLAQPGERPVSRFHTEKAVERISGVAQLIDAVVEESGKIDDLTLRAEVDASAALAREAVAAFAGWLRDELLPMADGDFRLGPDLYAEKFQHRLKTDLTPEQLRDRALRDFDAVRVEMARIARELWPDWLRDEQLPADENELIRRVLDAIAADHPAAEELLDFCRDALGRIEEFVRAHDVIGLADEPLDIIWTPEFLRSFGGAMLIPPGPLDRGLNSFFAITPMPDDWTDEQRESNLREDNVRMLRLLTIHEAVPGHYLQLAYANRSPSLVRAIFTSGVFAEGWAVYVTQVMMDLGYGADDPALMLVHWKFYLRAITNTLMDIAIHHDLTMNEDEAMRLMVDQGFQERSEASEKWNRARLSSTQLCEYYLGSVEMHELEREARRRAEAEGSEFVYRPFLERVLAQGTPSLPIIREILFAGHGSR
jgi:uncharacterized protein (DUF885 family)